MMLETWQRFERFCCHLAREDFPEAINTRGSWDGGRDVMVWSSLQAGDVIWQCKFTDDLGPTTQRSILDSIRSVVKHYEDFANDLAETRAKDPDYDQILATRALKTGRIDIPPHITKWILCIPVVVTAGFLDWLRLQLARYPFAWEVWDATALLERLERRPDILDRYFYCVYAELQRHFQKEDLEVIRFEKNTTLDQSWIQADPAVFEFMIKDGTHDPDLILDVILRNRGQLDTVLTQVCATVEWKKWKPHGLPSSGLLFSQITYGVSLGYGKEGSYFVSCEPPLLIRGHGIERCKIRLFDTGYSWRGSVRISLVYGSNQRLFLPYIGLYT